jgi:hypothetical protein
VEAGVGKDQLGRGAAREEFDHDFGFFRARMHVFAVGASLVQHQVKRTFSDGATSR